jgi:serine/threonine-protein phosphatase 2A regulatory subunit B
MQLCDLYENDCIFDKFDCCMNGSASNVASGSYSNTFKVFKCGEGAQGLPLEASRDPMRRRLQPAQKVRQMACVGAGDLAQVAAIQRWVAGP